MVSAAEDGDKVANTILHDAVQELAESVVAVVRRLTLCGEGNYYINFFSTICHFSTSSMLIIHEMNVEIASSQVAVLGFPW